MEGTSSLHAMDIDGLDPEDDMQCQNVQHTSISEPDLSASHALTDFDEYMPHLPDNVVRLVASHVHASKSCSIITLMAMCGVCKQWRSVASHMEPSAHIHFDGSKQMSTAGTQREQIYRKLSSAKRCGLLLAAATLFQGYSSATVSGDAANDTLLSEIAHASRSALTHITIVNAPEVTDIGVGTLAITCRALQHMSVTSISPDTRGTFLRKVMELPALDTLELHTPLIDLCPRQEAVPRCGINMATWPESGVRTLRLSINGIDTHSSGFFAKLPKLQALELDCGNSMVYNLDEARRCCAMLSEVHIDVERSDLLDAALPVLQNLPKLKVLDVTVAAFILHPDQLRSIGTLALEDLRLMSQVYKKQPSLSRLSHLDNSGVKALVDAVCARSFKTRNNSPLKLSICGASTLTHDAVSALLRLPMLVKLDVSGCNKINAMDKMRLIAKVKAGREQRGYNPMMMQAMLHGATFGNSLLMRREGSDI